MIGIKIKKPSVSLILVDAGNWSKNTVQLAER